MNMTASGAASNDTLADHEFSDADFQAIADLANKQYGLYLKASKKALVYSRLVRRLRALNLQSFTDYCKLLVTPEGHDEHSHLLSALTTNVTHFFREQHHFDFLRRQILPDLVKKARNGDRVRLWSSACSAGQEAYCIAAMIRSEFAEAHNYDIKVLATDIDRRILDTAKEGQYPIDQLAAIPEEYRNLMIDGRKTTDTTFHMSQHLRELIRFGELNLIADWPMRGKFDVIFCRNVAIYFDKTTQSDLWLRFSKALQLGGYLMIGHSERLGGDAEHQFSSVGITTYRKTT